MVRNISEARLLSLKFCSHLDNCSYFGNCMTYGSQDEAFCNCISANLDHTCASRSTLPQPSALVSQENDFLLPAMTLAILAIVVLALLYFAIRWRHRPSREMDTSAIRGISVALKSIEDV